MLKRNSQLIEAVMFVADMSVTAAAWALAFWVRFDSGLWPAPLGRPDFEHYARFLPVILLLGAFSYRYCRLYTPRRSDSLLSEWFDISRAQLLVFLLMTGVTFVYKTYEYSRGVFGIFLLFNASLLALERTGARIILRWARRHGWNVRRALIVGAGRAGQQLAISLRKQRWMGILPVGYVDARDERQGMKIHRVPVLGRPDALPSLIREHGIDQVYLALPAQEHQLLESLVASLGEETVDVRVIPDMGSFDALNHSIADVDGLPVILLRESPLYGWNQVLKRIADVAFSAVVLILISPLLLAIAVGVKLTSPGPVFYGQERMGLDGRVFKMWKFRSMRIDAEQQTGAKWAVKDDPRKTAFGSFLRKTSLDELPQFWNVLVGDMSVVGPRPERPVFIDQFKKQIPRYMLRHKMKAGITGWAQVNGWRGNTSLKKRIQYDLYYIENWSLWLDARIVLLTVARGFVNPNAY
ncbi:MAG: undecaprenyl-phosphate glucose phosphotransferase [Candidatus Brocadiae bacterium]|nr:undecaprenyl-phosphate glucose phosphotransferase [Candidatus Brocadiia bacterium]